LLVLVALVLVLVLVLALALMLVLMVRWLRRHRLLWMLFLRVVGMPRGVRLVVGVMGSSHTVHHGMTAKFVRSKLNHCRHWGSVPQIGA